MAQIDIDGKLYPVQAGDNVLAACLSLGLDLPYFCWHTAMGSAGACRQCAVMQYKDAVDTKGRLVMACMTPVIDNMRISLAAEQAHQFRSDNIELLMTNHPHDCPVCEEGGECHLQDMTVMTGHTFRRYRGKKRTHNNQNLGPFINHEMNRCIACYRCVRFYDEYAGGKDLQVLGVHNNVYFGRFEDGTLENEFSGNLVEVCPTGVFTDKTFSAHYARKWDLQTAPSICVHCSLGCNIAPGERYGTLRRVVNRYHGDVNGYFLCDRGRFGYGFVNSPKRIRTPLYQQAPVTVDAAIADFRELLETAKAVIGIGSPRASLEANFALRTLVGEDNFFAGLNDSEHSLFNTIVTIMRDGGVHTPSLKEVEQADAVLILGEDVTHSAPRLALSLRQSVRNAAFELADSMHIPRWQDGAIRQLPQKVRSPLFIASVYATRLDDVATDTYHGSPENIARLGFAIANCLDGSAPLPIDLSPAEQLLATAISDTLKKAQRPLIVSGCSCSSLAVVQATYNVAKALPSKDKQLMFTLPECNSLSLAIMAAKPLQQAFERISNGSADSVVILENDLYRRASSQTIDLFLDTAAQIVVIDSLQNKTTDKAELLLSSATFAEAEGTLVNNEGRAQHYFPVYPAAEKIRSSWQWLISVMDNSPWQHHDALTAACAKTFTALAAIIQAAPGSDYTVNNSKIPRQPHRYSGRTAMHADLDVSEHAPANDVETPFAFSMEGATAKVKPALLPVIWAPGWSSNQAINKFQEEIGGHLRGGDSGVRLFDASGSLPWFNVIPSVFKPEPGLWRVIALPHIFGSEELSLQSLPVRERLPTACVLLNPLDAEIVQVTSGDLVKVINFAGISVLKVSVLIEKTVPQGLLVITTGRPEFECLQNAMQVTLKKLTQQVQP
ncbi:NADH-quinone oxidoreductase subunit NuoG [Crenothrix sp.]|uniref:NADH-quinone oxidoreductase subunit NuoG n=1 Tax=Crenothrix sp. TaxID=3100433 RepID=UPI00374D0322